MGSGGCWLFLGSFHFFGIAAFTLDQRTVFLPGRREGHTETIVRLDSFRTPAFERVLSITMFHRLIQNEVPVPLSGVKRESLSVGFDLILQVSLISMARIHPKPFQSAFVVLALFNKLKGLASCRHSNL